MWYSRSMVVALFAVAVGLPAIAEEGPIRPDDALTPGVVASIDPTDVCGIIDGLTYSKRHRHTPLELKQVRTHQVEARGVKY